MHILIVVTSLFLANAGLAANVRVDNYVIFVTRHNKSLMKGSDILSTVGKKHLFNSVEVTDVLADTKDKDEIVESEFFDTRQAFLSFCQGNHYQYDTLPRAKHSSMMVLYHLHNPTAPAFVTTCNTCHHDIETRQIRHISLF